MAENSPNNCNSKNLNGLSPQCVQIPSLSMRTTNSSQEDQVHLNNCNDQANKMICEPGPGQYCNGKVSEENINIVHLAKDDLQLFEHQVAGHGSAEKGLLKHKNGCILKPLQPPPMGTREVTFYQHIHENRHPLNDCYPKLKPFVPAFHGVACLNTNSNENGALSSSAAHRYLLLEDLLEGFQKPCVMDVKIGSQTWSPDASETKINHERNKYKGTKVPLGLCLTGTHYYDVRTNEKCKMTRDFGKTLVPSTLHNALEIFFNKNNSVLYSNLVNAAINKLRNIESAFNVQRAFKLYGSSILIAYDAEYFDCEKNAQNNHSLEIPVRVFMIDFAHFHHSDDETLDENYLFGLRNFIKILCNVVTEPGLSKE